MNPELHHRTAACTRYAARSLARAVRAMAEDPDWTPNDAVALVAVCDALRALAPAIRVFGVRPADIEVDGDLLELIADAAAAARE